MYLSVVLAGLRWQIHWLQWSTVVNLWMNSCWWHRRQEEPQKRSCNKWQALVCTFPGLQCPRPVNSNKDRSLKSEHFLNKVSPKWKKGNKIVNFLLRLGKIQRTKIVVKSANFLHYTFIKYFAFRTRHQLRSGTFSVSAVRSISNRLVLSQFLAFFIHFFLPLLTFNTLNSWINSNIYIGPN